MPRAGKGQKVQAASGQQYGQAKAQEDSQAVVPLAQMPDPAMRPGAQALSRPSERPNENIMASAPVEQMQQMQKPDLVQRHKALNLLPVLEALSSAPDASPHLRNTTRKLKAFVGNVNELVQAAQQELPEE